MKKYVSRVVLLVLTALTLATAAFAKEGEPDLAPTAMPPAAGYYLVGDTHFLMDVEGYEAFQEERSVYTYEFDQTGAVDKRNKTYFAFDGTERKEVTQYRYDAKGRVIEEKSGNDLIGGEVSVRYTYNKAGQIETARRFYGNEGWLPTLVYTYDDTGHLVSCTDGGVADSGVIGSRAVYTYNSAGQCIECQERGCRVVYEYDAVGNNVKTSVYVRTMESEALDHLATVIVNTYEKLQNNAKPSDSVFADVPDTEETAWFYEPVKWAVSQKITTGVSDTEFAPYGNCTRAQAMTFLWRAVGEPEPKTAASPFGDIIPNSYYYKAVLWAYEEHITTGTDELHFSPEGELSRGQFVTFLHRMKTKYLNYEWLDQQPSEESDGTFADVAAGAYYYDAVRWAAVNQVTEGIGGGQFGPEETCTRAHVVTFLYRTLTGAK